MTLFTIYYLQCARYLFSLSPLYHIVERNSYLVGMAKQKTSNNGQIRVTYVY